MVNVPVPVTTNVNECAKDPSNKMFPLSWISLTCIIPPEFPPPLKRSVPSGPITTGLDTVRSPPDRSCTVLPATAGMVAPVGLVTVSPMSRKPATAPAAAICAGGAVVDYCRVVAGRYRSRRITRYGPISSEEELASFTTFRSEDVLTGALRKAWKLRIDKKRKDKPKKNSYGGAQRNNR